MGGKSIGTLLPLVALGAVGAATGGFGLAASPLNALGVGSLKGAAAQKIATLPFSSGAASLLGSTSLVSTDVV